MRTEVQDRLLEAFEQLAESQSLKDVTFSAVIERAAATRSYAYKLYQRGIESMIQELHENLVDSSLRGIRARVRELEPPVTFDQAVRVGIEAATEVIARHDLTNRVFGGDPQLLRQYLTVETDGTLVSILGDYAANCAATFGSLNPNLPDICRAFVWDVLVELTRCGSSDGLEPLTESSGGRLAETVDSLIRRLIEEINENGGVIDTRTERLSRAIAVPERPEAAHLRLILT